MMQDESERARHQTGLIHGLAAYAMWGLLPLYFKLFATVESIEVVAHRVIWSIAFLAIMIAANRLYPAFVSALFQWRIMGALAISALLIGANWLVFIWAVNAGHVVASSLGYFLNPLVNILLGVIFLHERLRRTQTIAVAIAALGVAVLAAGELQTLWISLTLAFSFAFYGLVRKLTPVLPSIGLAVETLLLTPFGLAILGWLASQGHLAFGRDSLETIMLICTGALTAIPLILFASAAQRLPLATLGLLQYIAPSMQFIVGAFILREPMSPARLASFAIIWIALALFGWDSYRAAKARA